MPVIKINNDSFRAVPIFPLHGVHLFPNTILPLNIFEPRYIEMLHYALEHDHLIAIADTEPMGDLPLPLSIDPETPDIRPILGAGVVVASKEKSDGRWRILVQGVTRISLVAERPQIHSFRQVRAEILHETDTDEALLDQDSMRVQELLLQLSDLNVKYQDVTSAILQNSTSPDMLSHMVSAHIITNSDTRRALFEELDPQVRLSLLYQELGQLTLDEIQRSDEIILH
jgi:uncharacterized protein